ncbi:hypothetical protein V5799_016862 [Amblyomma americanum]|uniref:Uncharacterized protein n=1 Tax=Amblyomma americanum TaxID=6943 RepID=A0AAQ4F4I2_AMBAM
MIPSLCQYGPYTVLSLCNHGTIAVPSRCDHGEITMSAWYIFLLMTWQSLVCGAVIPWSAYVFGPLAAFVARLTRPQFIAVVLEIALQNSGIAVVIVYTSLPLPDADLVIVPVVCQALLQGLPLYVLYTVMRIKKCISKRLHPKEEVPSESSS